VSKNSILIGCNFKGPNLLQKSCDSVRGATASEVKRWILEDKKFTFPRTLRIWDLTINNMRPLDDQILVDGDVISLTGFTQTAWDNRNGTSKKRGNQRFKVVDYLDSVFMSHSAVVLIKVEFIEKSTELMI